MRLWISCIILSCTVAFRTAAQDVGHAMIKNPVASAEEFAKAFEKNDQKVLRASRQDFIDGINVTIPEIKNLTIENFPAFIRGLSTIPCPTGLGKLSRVMSPSGVIDFFWERAFRPGEKCLFDNNTGRLVMSLYCGNLIMSPKSPTPEAVAKIEKPQDPPKVTETPSLKRGDEALTNPSSLYVQVLDAAIVQLTDRFGVHESNITKDTTFTLDDSRVSFRVNQRPVPPKVQPPVVKSGNFFTSKKFGILLALIAGGTGGYIIGQERVTVVCGSCK